MRNRDGGVVGRGCRWVAAAMMAAGVGLGGCTSKEASTRPAVQPEGTFFSSDIVDLINQQSRAAATTMPATEPIVLKQGEKSILIYPARHARPEILKEAVAGLLNPDGTVQDSAALNTLIIQDHPDTIENVRAVLDALDHPTAQLLVEARIVEVTLNDDLEYEIRHLLTVAASPSSFFQNADITLKTPGANPTPGQGLELQIRPFGAGDKTLDNFVRLLQTKGKANILSSPNLIVAPGTEASIITGQEVPIQSSTVTSGATSISTVFKRVGIKLRVSLQQITNDTARLDINPEVSAVTGSAQAGQGISNPIISLRNISSTLSLKDGEVLTIGGLMNNEDRRTTEGIPILQDIPWAGYAFKSVRNQKVRTQLIFFLRVHILPAGVPNALRLHKPGAGFESVITETKLLNPNAQTQPSLKEVTEKPARKED